MMCFVRITAGLFLLLCLFNCGDEMKGFSIEREPVFGFNKIIAGKEVKMVDVFDEKLSLIVSDSVRRNVQFLSTKNGERLKVDNWFFDFEKAIKYKKYYFLHQLVDSSFYKVIVVGRFFTKYYGFEQPWNQNKSIYDCISDTMCGSDLSLYRIDSIGSRDFIINPNSKKVIKAFYKKRLKGTYLRNEILSDEVVQDSKESGENFNIHELELDEGMGIYPSPAKGSEVKITSDLLAFKDASLSVFNLSGSIIECQQHLSSKSITVNIEKLKSGSYIAIVTSRGKRSCGKFIVTK